MFYRKNRRQFLGEATGLTLMATACEQVSRKAPESVDVPFQISLAQWSLHRSIFGGDPGEMMGWDRFTQTLNSADYRTVLAGEIDPIDFAKIARRDFQIDAVEYVNTFFFDRAEDRGYLTRMREVADGEGVRNVLIMCDAEGALGHPDEAARLQTVQNHHKWVQAAEFLGCQSIRVNAQSDETLPPEEQQRLAADGLHRLAEFAQDFNINVLVENHGGLSSDAAWLVGVMKLTDHPSVGTLPDFGNFDISDDLSYDPYQGVTELMPFAKSVSAKSYDFDAEGNETSIDFERMMRIVLDAGFRGYVGIEYEGTRLSEPDGIRATKTLLERIRIELAPSYASQSM
jgi:sugar phosphate isomerase/epimerase